MKKIVLTGGEQSGKSTLLHRLYLLGYPILDETGPRSSLNLIEHQGIRRSRRWRYDNWKHLMIGYINSQSLREEQDIPQGSELVVLNRGLYDFMASMKLRNIRVPKRINNFVKQTHYDLVFVLETIDNLERRTHEGYIQSNEESVKFGEIVRREYQYYGHDVIDVPFMDSIDNRVAFVDSVIREKFPDQTKSL